MGLSNSSYELQGTVSAVFFSKKDVENACKGLLSLGYSVDDISLLISDERLTCLSANPNKVEESDSNQINNETNGVEKSRVRRIIVDAILAITSRISKPELGVIISRRLLGEVSDKKISKNNNPSIATQVPKQQGNTFKTELKEGGIIISVDPKNRAEKEAIIREFRNSNGQDILGDDGYTPLS